MNQFISHCLLSLPHRTASKVAAALWSRVRSDTFAKSGSSSSHLSFYHQLSVFASLMATVLPPIVTRVAAGAVATPEDLVFFLASEPLVLATPFLEWRPVPAAAGAPEV